MGWRIALLLVGMVMTASLSAQPPEKSGKNELLEEAEMLFRQGKPEEAFKKIEDAVKKNPGLPPARLLLAKLLLAAKQLPPARSNLELAFAENPEHPEIYLVNASLAFAEGRITETILNCRSALTFSNAERWNAEQKRYFQLEARTGLANAFEARRDWASARTELTFWLELGSNAQIRQRLGRALFYLNKTEEAFVELQNAHKEDPTLDPPELALGRFAAQKEDATLSEEWFAKAVAKYPKNPKVHQAYGGWLLDVGKSEAAKVHIETSATLDPKSRETLGLQGLLARYQRNFPAAEKVFESLYQENPADFFSANQLALVLIESTDDKQKKKAISLAEVNARQYPRMAEALATLGWIYYRSGRFEEADQVFGAVGTAGQVSADTAYYMAKLLHTRGKSEDARKILDKALESKTVFVNRTEAQTFAVELKGKK
jgi:tetratricopeptide (TPR) repeat protein